MLYLGTDARILYESKNQRTGLSDIEAHVIKPNGSSLLPIALNELGGVVGSGFYFFDLTTIESDPEGDWVIIINSPTEGHKAKAIRSFVERPDGGGATETVIVNTPDRIIAKTRQSSCKIALSDDSPLKVLIQDNDAQTSMQDTQSTQKINDQQHEVRT